MTAQAAPGEGCAVTVVERAGGSPAGQIVGPAAEIVGDWREEAVRARLLMASDAIVLENEFIDPAALAWFEKRGCPVFPSAAVLAVIQDKLTQKQMLQAAGVPVPDFSPVASVDDVRRIGEAWGWPIVVKARRNGYDGYGNVTLRAGDDIGAALERLGGGTGAGAPGGLYAERWVPFVAELATTVAIGSGGEMVLYPVVATTQENHICHEVIAPAPIDAASADGARAVARGAAAASGAVGLLAVEMFLLADGRVLANELAPRPHNSGHYSIEACLTSQFTNLCRIASGRPPGPTTMVCGGAAMVNLLGTTSGPARPTGLEAVAAVPDSFVHIYGKAEVRRGRKMGHVTALADSPADALARARAAARMIGW